MNNNILYFQSVVVKKLVFKKRLYFIIQTKLHVRLYI